jgi:hypothetical protein
MRQFLCIFVLFAFVFSASGLSKYIQNHASQDNVQLSAVEFNIAPKQENITKCCTDDGNPADNQQPRCIGEICIEAELVTSNVLGYGKKLSIQTYNYVSADISALFLRPPIA